MNEQWKALLAAHPIPWAIETREYEEGEYKSYMVDANGEIIWCFGEILVGAEADELKLILSLVNQQPLVERLIGAVNRWRSHPDYKHIHTSITIWKLVWEIQEALAALKPENSTPPQL